MKIRIVHVMTNLNDSLQAPDCVVECFNDSNVSENEIVRFNMILC